MTGQELRELRQRHSLSQEVFANSVGLSVYTIVNLEQRAWIKEDLDSTRKIRAWQDQQEGGQEK